MNERVVVVVVAVVAPRTRNGDVRCRFQSRRCTENEDGDADSMGMLNKPTSEPTDVSTLLERRIMGSSHGIVVVVVLVAVVGGASLCRCMMVGVDG